MKDFRPQRCSLRRLSELEGYFIRRGASLYIWHQIASVAVLLILFGLTPILAQQIYLPFACAISVLTANAICALQWTLMWHDRFILGIDGKVLRAEMLHVLLCPPNAINTTRRLAGRRRMRFDAKTVLCKFSRLDAETYEAQFLGVTPANA